jgi:hypothetical protein
VRDTRRRTVFLRLDTGVLLDRIDRLPGHAREELALGHVEVLGCSLVAQAAAETHAAVDAEARKAVYPLFRDAALLQAVFSEGTGGA